MGHRVWGKPAATGGALLVVMALTACGSSALGSGPHTQATAGLAVAPQTGTRASSGGTPGKGPLVISNPARIPGGTSSSQRIVLGDRTLVITSATRQRAANQSSVLIHVELAVRNTGAKAIQNEPSFFELMSSEGDVFGLQGNTAADFFRGIDPHASRTGFIEFDIPAAAASGLYLLYRPENATETVLTRLNTG